MTFRTGQALQLKPGFNPGSYRVFTKESDFPLPHRAYADGEQTPPSGSGVTGDAYTTLYIGFGLNFKMLSSVAREAYEPAQ